MPFTIYMPKLSPTMSEGVIARWLKRVGDRVEAGDVLLEISTDKATVEHSALDEGWLRQIIGQDGQKIAVNAPLAILTEKQDESIEGYIPPQIQAATPKPAAPQQAPAISQKPALKAATPVMKPAPVAPPTTERVLASPLAKKLASDRGIELSYLKGSGPHGRIMSRDLDQPVHTHQAYGMPMQIVEEAMSPMRRVIAQRLQESKSTIPHFYVRQGIDAGALIDMKEELKRLELSYTVNDFIIAACSKALEKHPEINSGFNEATQSIMRFSRVDICLAVTIPGGLITPIITDTNHKSLAQISKEAKALALKAREGKLTPEEYQGGSFTISNLGMYGVSEMTGIINPPQGAILGVGAVTDTPMVRNGVVVAGKKMVLTLSCDHRIIDGAHAAEFMRTLKQLIESPLLFLTQ